MGQSSGKGSGQHSAYALLKSIGVDASVVEQDLFMLENKIGEPPWWMGWESVGLMEVHGGPIRYVKVLSMSEAGPGVTKLYTHIYRHICLVADPTVCEWWEWGEKGFGAESKRMRSVPFIGKVVGIRWSGSLPADVFRRLEEDSWLNQTLIKLKKDIKIHCYATFGYWAISYDFTVYFGRSGFLAELWDCCTAIAHYLLQRSKESPTYET